MSISGPGGSAARPGEDRGGAEYAQPRELLAGPERDQLNELELRLRSFSLRASDVGDVLPEAVLLRAGRDPALRQTLQPALVEALRSTIRKAPALLADTLFPIIGAAVRKAVAVRELPRVQDEIESRKIEFATGQSSLEPAPAEAAADQAARRSRFFRAASAAGRRFRFVLTGSAVRPFEQGIS